MRCALLVAFVPLVDAAAKCSDIVTTMSVWGRSAKGVRLDSYTGAGQLVWIGCIGDGCSPSSFTCSETSNSITFGTPGILRALHGVTSIPSSYSSCCSGPGGLCNAPDKQTDANAMCTALGYQSASFIRVSSNACPEAHYNAATNKWESDFSWSQGYGRSYTCSGHLAPTTAPPTSAPPTNTPTVQPTDTPTSQPTSRPTDAPAITSAHCSDIVTSERVFGRTSKGVNVASYTGPGQLVWIGCPQDGCDAHNFYCKDGTNGGTVGTLEFGTTQHSAMRALHGVASIADSKWNGCCKKAGGLCNSPDKDEDATALCIALGYASGTVEKVTSNSCPEVHYNTQTSVWESDFHNSHGWGKKFVCTGYVSPAPAPGVSGDPFTEYNGQKKQFYLPFGESSQLIQCGDLELFGNVISSGIAGDAQQWFSNFRVRFADKYILSVGAKSGLSLSEKDGDVADSDVKVLTVGDLKSQVQEQLQKVQLAKQKLAHKEEVRITPGGAVLTKQQFVEILGEGAWEIAPRNMANLTTLNVITTNDLGFNRNVGVEGVYELANNKVSVTVSQDTQKIGKGFVEHVDIQAGAVEMRMTSSVAHKFTKTENIHKLHIDLAFTKLNAADCIGLLPELWGVKPMTKATSILLQPPKEQTQS